MSFGIILGPAGEINISCPSVSLKHLMAIPVEERLPSSVYRPDGVFRILGKRKIEKILAKNSSIDPIVRMQQAATTIWLTLTFQWNAVFFYPMRTPPWCHELSKDSISLTVDWNYRIIDAFTTCLRDIVDQRECLSVLSVLKPFVSLTGFPLTFLTYALDDNREKNKRIFFVAEKLLELGADLDTSVDLHQNNFIGYSLPDAPFSPFMFNWYCNHGGTLGFVNADGNTLFHLILSNLSSMNSSCSALFIVQELLLRPEAFRNYLELPNNHGDFPIHLLSLELFKNPEYKQHRIAACELLETIASLIGVNQRDRDGFTPMSLYIRTGQTEFVRILARYPKGEGDDAKTYLNDFIWYLHRNSTMYERVVLDELSLRSRYKAIEKIYMPLLKAMLPHCGGSNEGLRQLLITKEEGTTLLHQMVAACSYISHCLFDQFFIRAEDLELMNEDGETVLMLQCKVDRSYVLIDACAHHEVETAKKLLQEDLFLAAGTNDGENYLHLAINSVANESPHWGSVYEIVYELLDKGMDPNWTNQMGESPLHYALKKRTKSALPIIKLLLEFGADLDIKDFKGITPRHLILESDGLFSLEDVQ